SILFFEQGYVVVFPSAHLADRHVTPFFVRKNGRDFRVFHVHRAALHTVDRAVVDDSFEVKTLHYRIVLLSMVIPGPLHSRPLATCRNFHTTSLPRSGHRIQCQRPFPHRQRLQRVVPLHIPHRGETSIDPVRTNRLWGIPQARRTTATCRRFPRVDAECDPSSSAPPFSCASTIILAMCQYVNTFFRGRGADSGRFWYSRHTCQ